MRAQQLGPYSRGFARGAIGATVDGRSREGRFLRVVEQTLTQHVGGSPSATQRMLIGRAARLALQIEIMDERALAAGGEMSEGNERRYLAWTNSLRLIMRELGPARGAKPPSLAEALAAGRAATA